MARDIRKSNISVHNFNMNTSILVSDLNRETPIITVSSCSAAHKNRKRDNPLSFSYEPLPNLVLSFIPRRRRSHFAWILWFTVEEKMTWLNDREKDERAFMVMSSLSRPNQRTYFSRRLRTSTLLK